MRISILGAGAIGAYLAGRLGAAGGGEVHVIARGAALAAIERDGIAVEGTVAVRAKVSASRIDQAPPADVLISCVKAFAVPDLSAHVKHLVKPDGLWVCVVNGIPWWYGAAPANSVDPGGRIRASFPVARTAGCVAYLRCQVRQPGVVVFSGGSGLIMGLPERSMPPLLDQCAARFVAAGIPAKTTDDIKTAVWNKLFGNVALNPLSAITGFTIRQLLEDPDLNGLMTEMISEAMALADAEGAKAESDPCQRVQAMVALGPFRTSMLQDVDAGRPIELDGILGAMIEVADRRGIDVPACRRVYALARAFASSRGLMPGAAAQ